MRDRSETRGPAARDILTALECGRAGCPCHLSARRGHGPTHCPVPGHGRGQGDRGPSLRVSEGRDKPLFKCFTGCESAAVVAALKDRSIYPNSRPADDGSKAERSQAGGVTLRALAAAKGLPLEFLRGLGCRDVEHHGAPAVAIPYRDRSGVPMFERRRLSLAAQGRRFWQPAGVTVAPYGLDRLGEARRLGRILLVEGESDCWALWRHREAALGLPGKGTWRPEWARHLEGVAAVYLWQEPDAADLTERVARDLPAVRVIQAPEAGIKDVAEAQARGLDLRSWLARLQADATGPAPATLAHEQVTLGAIPRYPISILPAPLRELVEANPDLPAALVAGAGMTALAAAIGPRVAIELQPGWRRRPILWVANIAPRGAGKSPAQAAAFQPLRDYDATVVADYRMALLEWRKAPPKRRGPRPHDPTLLGNDQTLEALARRLDRADGAAALDIDELSQFLRGLGEYKKGGGGDRGRLLALWTGDPWRIERVTDDLDIYVARPVVLICGGLQPALHDLLGPESDGLRPRWLPHVAAMPEATMSPAATPAPESWASLLRDLIARRDQDRVLTFEPRARARFLEHQHRWKTAGSGDEGESVSAALVKADQQALAMLLVLAEAEARRAVDVQLVDRAAAAIDFCLDCWRALPEQGALLLSRKDEVLDQGVERLRGYLEEHGGRATRRDLLRTAAAGVRTAADLAELLKRYVAVYPGTVWEEATPGGGPPRVIVSAPSRDASRQRTASILHFPGNGGVVSADHAGCASGGGKGSPSELGDTPEEADVSGSEGADIAAADNGTADNVDGHRPPGDDAGQAPGDREWEVRL